MISYSAKIQNMSGASNPDSFVPSGSGRPCDEFVVSRDKDGQALSLYGDMIWDRSPYSTSGRRQILNFAYWEDDLGITKQRLDLIAELKWIIFLQIYVRSGHSLSNNSLIGQMSMLRVMARECEGNHTAIKDVLSNCGMALRYLDANSHGRRFAALIGSLRAMPADLVGFEVAGRVEIRKFKNAVRRYRTQIRQHPPIPSRIYSLILLNIREKILEVEHHLDRLLNLAGELYGDPMIGISKNRRRSLARKYGLPKKRGVPVFLEIFERHDLSQYWKENGYSYTRIGVRRALLECQAILSKEILAFSGMRTDEMETLPPDCLEIITRDGEQHYLVNGRTTKLNNGKIKRVKWVTSPSAANAIRLAERIAIFLYGVAGHDLNASAKMSDKFFLFVSPEILGDGIKAGLNKSATYNIQRIKNIGNVLRPAIEQEDINELYMIDPNRNWDGDAKFQIGSPWPLTNHQFRRALAIFGQRSGLVSAPTLKRQLKHITFGMSYYYGRGFALATDLLGTGYVENRFAKEWLEARPVSQYLGYSKAVFSAEKEDLFGGHVSWVNSRLRGMDGVIQENREVTLQRFKRGELSYISTPIGGCANPGPCDRNPIDILQIKCIEDNCKHLVASLTKTERVIAIKKREVESLRANCSTMPEVRHEEAELHKLIVGYESAKAKISRPRGKL